MKCTCKPVAWAHQEHQPGCALYEPPLTQAEIRVLRRTALADPHRHR